MSAPAKFSVTLSLLQSYYTSVHTLHAYLSDMLECLGTDHRFLQQHEDTPQYRKFLYESYVAKSVDDKGARRFKVSSPMVPVREIIDRAQEKLFVKFKGRPSNVITSGYRIASRNGDRGKLAMSRTPLTNYFLNTVISALQGPEWETLFSRIGEDMMFHLLTETSIFMSLPNECLCQMTGEPVIHLKPPPVVTGIRNAHEAISRVDSQNNNVPALKRQAAGSHPDERPPKRPKTSLVASASAPHAIGRPFQERTPSEITLARSRMFYAWPQFLPHASNIAVGLPPKHVLNCISPAYTPKPKSRADPWVDPDPNKQAEHVRRLAKYVFPRQFGLPSPFVVPQGPQLQAYKLPDYTDREEEIKKKGPCKTPKRLKSVLTILDKLLWMHGRCGYKALLEMACPSKVKAARERPLDNIEILEMMSEHSIQLHSQAVLSGNISLDTAGRSIIGHGLSQAKKYHQQKPRFAEFSCGFAEVCRYAALVTNAVIPKILWGCDENYQLILRHIKFFVRARRFESTTLHNILQGFNVMECDWLMPDTPIGRVSSHVPVTDYLKRRELLEEFLFWYFDSFLLPLLKTTFYITDSSALRRRVLYFRQDDWATLCAPLVEKLSSVTFQKLDQHEAQEILRQRQLGFSFVRLLPKETGVRPIVNLRRRKTSGKSPYDRPQQSINQILQAAFQILTYEKENQANIMGASVFGSNEIYTKLKAFKSHLVSTSISGMHPKLYFVKVDVQACFDTIEQSKLLEILRDIISEGEYMIQRYGQVNSVGSKVKRKYAKKAQPEDSHPNFLDSATQLAAALRHTIFVDQVVYPFSKKEDIMKLLEEHITDNIVKIGSDFYRQTIGIPQGSVLSALLCSFFYGDLERKKLKFTDDPSCVLLRLIDDYLLISTSLPKATKFLDVMVEGHPEYGCLISKEKTLTNFDYDPLMNRTEPVQKSFPWCGYMINMKDLSVSADYSRYHANYLQDSLTVDIGRRPGVAFSHKMLQLTKAKSHIIYSDEGLNSKHTIYLNIYQNFLLSAMKMHYYLRHWGLSISKSTTFIWNTVQQMIRYTYAAMRNKASNRVAKASNGRCGVQEAEVLWLGTHAFHTVLSRKPHTYPRLIKMLEFNMSLPRHRRLKKQLRGIVKEGLDTLILLAF